MEAARDLNRCLFTKNPENNDRIGNKSHRGSCIWRLNTRIQCAARLASALYQLNPSHISLMPVRNMPAYRQR